MKKNNKLQTQKKQRNCELRLIKAVKPYTDYTSRNVRVRTSLRERAGGCRRRAVTISKSYGFKRGAERSTRHGYHISAHQYIARLCSTTEKRK